jgi:hypothetical protein
LAVTQHLPRVDQYIPRDSLNEYTGPETILVMNGWFSREPSNWPPAPQIHPIFVGFHMTEKTAAAYKHHAGYFKAHEPIGCRDQRTATVLNAWGVRTWVSYCPTLTFPRRQHAATGGQVVLVDCDRFGMPSQVRNGCVPVTHSMMDCPTETRLAYAQAFLDYYRANARLIVTSRLHCALPALAMGIPTIFIGPQEERTSILSAIGLPMYRPFHKNPWPWLIGAIDWDPEPLDVSRLAVPIVSFIKENVARLDR